MRLLIFVIMVLFAGIGCLRAEDGDTNIHVFYSDKIERIAPDKSSHVVAVDVYIVLHRNGKVDDRFIVGRDPRGSSKSKLGATYRVIDATTVERTSDVGNYQLRVTVKVSGKNCTAQVDHILKPGEKNYRIYDPALKGYATASVLQTVHSECEIK
jgi:hypothetical protein